jgi:hypothetical protein
MEHVNLNSYLKEALLSQRNRIDMALVIFDKGEELLMATALEDIWTSWQSIMDKYCFAEHEDVDHICGITEDERG